MVRSLKCLQFEKGGLALQRTPGIPPDGEGIGISPLRVCSASEVNSHVSININWYSALRVSKTGQN